MSTVSTWDVSGVSDFDGERYFIDSFDTKEQAEAFAADGVIGVGSLKVGYSDFEVDYETREYDEDFEDDGYAERRYFDQLDNYYDIRGFGGDLEW